MRRPISCEHRGPVQDPTVRCAGECTVAATPSLVALAGAVSELRQSCRKRLDSQTAADRYAEVRDGVAGLALLAGLLAAVPVVVALA
ncbi:MAG: hypothetical protein M3N47_03925 [Chloroflexota bacterium]|nr:hypothetical protein [Chloroflexota bacterium]